MNSNRLTLLKRFAFAITFLLSASGALAYYNPSAGRWISRDPLEENGERNLHGFVHNAPTYAIDSLGLAPAALFICECAKSVTIQNVIRTHRFEGITVFGHYFEVAIDLEYTKKREAGSATLEWWEKTDVVPMWYGNKVKPNEWADIYDLSIRGDIPAISFPGWNLRDKSEGRRTVILPDEPKIGMLAAKAVKRTMEFDVAVRNPKCCCEDKDNKSRPHVTARQDLSTFPEDPLKIRTQDFNTPNGPIQ